MIVGVAPFGGTIETTDALALAEADTRSFDDDAPAETAASSATSAARGRPRRRRRTGPLSATGAGIAVRFCSGAPRDLDRDRDHQHAEEPPERALRQRRGNLPARLDADDGRHADDRRGLPAHVSVALLRPRPGGDGRDDR